MDDHLKNVVNALHGAVRWAMSHRDDPKVFDNAIQDCKEILDVIMEGDVTEWLN